MVSGFLVQIDVVNLKTKHTGPGRPAGPLCVSKECCQRLEDPAFVDARVDDVRQDAPGQFLGVQPTVTVSVVDVAVAVVIVFSVPSVSVRLFVASSMAMMVMSVFSATPNASPLLPTLTTFVPMPVSVTLSRSRCCVAADRLLLVKNVAKAVAMNWRRLGCPIELLLEELVLVEAGHFVPPLPSENVLPKTLPKLPFNQLTRAVPPSFMSFWPFLFCQKRWWRCHRPGSPGRPRQSRSPRRRCRRGSTPSRSTNRRRRPQPRP